MRGQRVRTAAFTFTVYVTVDPTVLAKAQDKDDLRSPEMVVADEITSNLESVPYVTAAAIQRIPNADHLQSLD